MRKAGPRWTRANFFRVRRYRSRTGLTPLNAGTACDGQQASTWVDARLDTTQPCSTPLNQESNTAHATSTSGGESLGLANSVEKSVGYAEGGNSSIPATICERRRWCSEVAEPIADALEKIDAGKVDVARERLEALLRMLH